MYNKFNNPWAVLQKGHYTGRLSYLKPYRLNLSDLNFDHKDIKFM